MDGAGHSTSLPFVHAFPLWLNVMLQPRSNLNLLFLISRKSRRMKTSLPNEPRQRGKGPLLGRKSNERSPGGAGGASRREAPLSAGRVALLQLLQAAAPRCRCVGVQATAPAVSPAALFAQSAVSLLQPHLEARPHTTQRSARRWSALPPVLQAVCTNRDHVFL